VRTGSQAGLGGFKPGEISIAAAIRLFSAHTHGYAGIYGEDTGAQRPGRGRRKNTEAFYGRDRRAIVIPCLICPGPVALTVARLRHIMPTKGNK